MVSGFCPTQVDEPSALLHRPITLPCGHTLSADHVVIPSPPRIQYQPGLPEHEIHALQQRQQAQRLSMWASVMCPIPSCKRYSASAATSTYNPSAAEHEIESQQLGRVSSGVRRAEMLASGVAYYPPPPSTHPEFNSEPHVTETGSPLLDITIEKIIGIVQREVARLEDDTITTTAALRLVELHDRQPIDIDVQNTHGDETSSPTLSEASSNSSSLGRAPSKRQRNRLDLNEHLGDTSTSGSEENYRRSPGSGRGSHERFEKEMLGHLECDVCACLLHEPVTTPCQHVSHALHQ